MTLCFAKKLILILNLFLVMSTCRKFLKKAHQSFCSKNCLKCFLIHYVTNPCRKVELIPIKTL